MVRGIISVKSEVAHLGATEEKQIRIVKKKITTCMQKEQKMYEAVKAQARWSWFRSFPFWTFFVF